MSYSTHLPYSWARTCSLLADGIWDSWQQAHPVLGDVRALEDLRGRLLKNPRLGDEVVAALLAIRATQLASRSCPSLDSELLLSVTGHLLPGVLGNVCSRLVGRVEDIDRAVVTALWLALSEGATAVWDSPRSSLAWRVWVIAVEDLAGTTRAERRNAMRAVPLETLPEDAYPIAIPTGCPGTAPDHVDATPGSVSASSLELIELLTMAREDPSIDNAHVDLLLELVTTAIEGSLAATDDQPWHFNHEVSLVARRRGVSGRSIRRQRAQAAQSLRAAALAWQQGEPTPTARAGVAV